MPPMNIQIMFISRDRQLFEVSDGVTFLPNGQSASIPIFKVCSPKGMPMMVIIRPTLDIKYSMAVAKPPKMSHRRLRIIFMICCCLVVMLMIEGCRYETGWLEKPFEYLSFGATLVPYRG